MLRPQDILLVLKIKVINNSSDRWTFESVGKAIGISASQAHLAMRRAIKSNLIRADGTTRDKAILETLFASVYYFPGEFGGLTRGVPTAYAASPLKDLISPGDEPPPVWPDPEGTVRGLAYEPLYKTVPWAARQDPKLYELLALVDAIRSGRKREAKAASKELTARLQGHD